MEQFSHYCTVEQTRRARSLGAPIKEEFEISTERASYLEEDGKVKYLITPTTQQMIWWLKSLGFKFEFIDGESGISFNMRLRDKEFNYGNVVYSGDYAELSAIDMALDYLEELNKKSINQ